MNKEEFCKEIKKQAKEIEVILSEEQLEKFYNFKDMLIEWNKKINLTTIIEPKEIIQKHFIDSLTISKYIHKNSKIIDIGTGAGFPGIPIKIANEDIEIVLLDSLNKRIKYLNEVIEQLKLKDIKTIHYRAEEAGQNQEYREKFDIAISRAVAPLNILVEYLIPFIKVNGRCICMKGSNIQEELEKSKNAIKSLGGEIEQIEEFVLPNSDIKRNIIVIKKIKATLNKYPRKPGIPSKLPII